jgi:hypothetical protein
MSKTRDRKRRAIASRTALSERNIVEFAIEQSSKVQKRNQSACSQCLVTKPNAPKFTYVPPPQRPIEGTV